MFRSQLRIALRALLRHKVYSLINLLGLAVGMACACLILLYVRSELSYDRFHPNAERVFRVTREWLNEDGATNLHLGHVAPPIAALLRADFPEIEEAVRLMTPDRLLVGIGGRSFLEDHVVFSDSGFFRVFGFRLLRGDPATALSAPSGVVITERAARKYFGDADPMGRTLRFDGRIDAAVTGVVAPAPANSHFHFDFIGSLSTLQAMYGPREFENWGSNNYATYLLLRPGYPAERISSRLPAFLEKHRGPGASKSNRLHLQRLTDIHLRSHLDSEIEANSDIAYVYVFTAIAAFILLIACVNFTNLSTARSSARAREIGLRKVSGADRGRLVRQFLGEALLLSGCAMVLAAAAVLAAKGPFGAFMGRELAFHPLREPGLLLGLLGLAALVGLAAGFYPALVLSSLRPAAVLRASRGASGHGAALRTALVVFQFAVSIVLIVGVGVVSRQLEYARSKRLGFDREQVLTADVGPEMRARFEGVRAELLEHPGILGVAGSRRVPSGRLLDSSEAAVLDGETARPAPFRIAYVCVDHDFIPTYRMELAAGRNFSRDFPTDATEGFILNETAVRELGWTPDEALGRGFRYGRARRGTIVGVVRDFHFESLHQPIAPLVLYVDPAQYRLLSVRIAPGAVPSTLEFLRKKWAAWRPGYPFEYSFLDRSFEDLYRAERKLGAMFRGFSLLAVFIACLGLYGLASFAAGKRLREIGIRKVLGATSPGLVAMLSRDFTRWVLAANLAAAPVAYLAMRKWLGGFAYRVSPSADLFVRAGLAALAIALLTVSGHALRAARRNPAEVLRSE